MMSSKSFSTLQRFCKTCLFDINNTKLINRQLPLTIHRQFSVTPSFRQEEAENEEEDRPKIKSRGIYIRDPQKIDPDVSIRYMESTAYKNTYGDLPVWHHYRRNYKGHFAPKTRKYCIRNGRYSTNNPCPICRDDHLVISPKNIKLLEQFILKQNAEVIPTGRTGVCQTVHKHLLIAVEQAKDCGFIEAYKPHRMYNYDEYYEIANMTTKRSPLKKEEEIK